MKTRFSPSIDIGNSNFNDALLKELSKDDIDLILLWTPNQRLMIATFTLRIPDKLPIDLLFAPIRETSGGLTITVGKFDPKELYEVELEVYAQDDLEIVAALFNQNTKKPIVRQPQLKAKVMKGKDKPWIVTLKP